MIIDDYFYEKFMKNPEKGTQRIFNFLSKIGHPQKKLNNIIHVTGTNGKGSTIEFIRSCLSANKLTANIFTSPHLLSVNERFIIKNKIIGDNSLSSVIEKCNEFYSYQELSFLSFLLYVLLNYSLKIFLILIFLRLGLEGYMTQQMLWLRKILVL